MKNKITSGLLVLIIITGCIDLDFGPLYPTSTFGDYNYYDGCKADSDYVRDSKVTGTYVIDSYTVMNIKYHYENGNLSRGDTLNAQPQYDFIHNILQMEDTLYLYQDSTYKLRSSQFYPRNISAGTYSYSLGNYEIYQTKGYIDLKHGYLVPMYHITGNKYIVQKYSYILIDSLNQVTQWKKAYTNMSGYPCQNDYNWVSIDLYSVDHNIHKVIYKQVITLYIKRISPYTLLN